jgi:hypothetical protein
MKDTEQIFIDQTLTTMLVKKSKYVPGFVGSDRSIFLYFITSWFKYKDTLALTYHKISSMMYLKKETENTEK